MKSVSSGQQFQLEWREVDDTHLSRDEAAEIVVDVLGEGHAEEREPGLEGRHNVLVTSERVTPSLGLSSGQLALDLLKTLGVIRLGPSKALV